ncbi:hypothetical protein TSOC_012413 [Tetrabaena socialis]|uniref:Uncharacterized protein n=1 Tax=Tetrabaena socialis TaxID=47790 RepID=A0A2J7ZN32_9CHLO|nr:hypothetical protein TSOC_012413 [Tetrabaena socialis]|eukprot:PNH01683.1 hypothetical protein TSOC_012413 [Tetrabaena socialis]
MEWGAPGVPRIVRFQPSHPLYETHCLRWRPQPLYIQFIGKLPLRPAVEGDSTKEDADRYYAFVLGTFAAYRSRPTPPGHSLREVYDAWRRRLRYSSIGRRYLDLVDRILHNIAARAASDQRARQRAKDRKAAEAAECSSDDESVASGMEGAAVEGLQPVDTAWKPDAENFETLFPADMEPDMDAALQFDRTKPAGEYAYQAVTRCADTVIPCGHGLGAGRSYFMRRADSGDEAGVREAVRRLKDTKDKTTQPNPKMEQPLSQQKESLHLTSNGLQVQACVRIVNPYNDTEPPTIKHLSAGSTVPYILLDEPPTIEKTIQLFTLASEQGVAFMQMARAFLAQKQHVPHRPCRIIIIGGPGTGKSQIVKALLWFVYQHGYTHWLTTTAYTWTAVLQLNTPLHRGYSTTTACQLEAFKTPDRPRINSVDAGMKAKGVICSNCYAFTELWEHWDRERVPQLTLPLGLRKMEVYGIQNAIIEANRVPPHGLGQVGGPAGGAPGGKTKDPRGRGQQQREASGLGEDGFFEIIEERCRWVRSHLSLPGRLWPAATFVNIRDFNTAMAEVPGRVLRVVRRLGQLEPDVRPAGLMMEDPSGGKLPFQLGPWVASVRQAAALECLASGCDGVWAALCDEGAATGHAGSLGTLVNLARLGNPHVRQQYNLVRMRNSAVRLTRSVSEAGLVTGAEPHPRTEVYGRRAALDGDWWTEAGWGGLASPLNPPGAKLRFGEGKTIDEEEPMDECRFPDVKVAGGDA